jgi:ubiquinone/menaquinone biosynthesis C-methylase UbiE
MVTGRLHELGVEVSGLDLSPGMLAEARKALPALEFTEGSMLALPTPSASLGGVVAWYSTIHVPDDLLPDALTELTRVLRPGGHLLLAFQTADEPPLHLTTGFGHDIQLDFHRRTLETMTALLADAGVPVWVRTVREPDGDRTPQAFLLARKPA